MAKKIKILIFTASFPPPLVGGSVEYIYNYTNNLPDDSCIIHTSHNFCQDNSFEKKFKQKIIRRFYVNNVHKKHSRYIIIRKLSVLLEFFCWPISAFFLVALNKPDVVNIGEHNFAGLGVWLACKIYKIPYVYFTYAEEITMLSKKQFQNRIFSKLLNDSSCVISVSNYTKNILIKSHKINPDKIKVVLPSVSERKLFKIDQINIQSVVEKFNLKSKSILLTVGSIESRKGHISVLEAIVKLKDKIPNLLYIIVGSGPLKSDLELFIQKNQIQNHVLFTGRIDDDLLNILYDICDVFILLHRQLKEDLNTEGCPTVFLEASSHGKPVIGGNAGGVHDAILHGETGYIIDGENIEEFSKTLIEILSNSDLRKLLGENGKKYTANFKPNITSNLIYQYNLEVSNRLK